MTVFGVLPGPLDGVKIAVDKLIEYQQRDDIEVTRSESDGSGKTYELTPRSEEARELLEEETYEDAESDLTPENPVPTDNGGDNEMTEAPEYVEETYDLLDDLGTALDRKDTATAERRATEVKDKVYGILDDLERTEDAFQQYDESMREHMDDWTDQLDDYLGRLGQRNQQAHNAARDLMETERALLDYELDERTEELIDIAQDL